MIRCSYGMGKEVLKYFISCDDMKGGKESDYKDALPNSYNSGRTAAGGLAGIGIFSPAIPAMLAPMDSYNKNQLQFKPYLSVADGHPLKEMGGGYNEKHNKPAAQKYDPLMYWNVSGA